VRRRETTWKIVSLIGIVTEIVVKEAHFGDMHRIHLRQTSDQLLAVTNLVINLHELSLIERQLTSQTMWLLSHPHLRRRGLKDVIVCFMSLSQHLSRGSKKNDEKTLLSLLPLIVVFVTQYVPPTQ